ncbi:bifunctional diaminohydroxyphosphoribosylaminopyrimidine deaminase/5-amino-6-(5-phosphoribosylamino)uracil reductase RibD [Oceanicaulis sp. MMSF_3324]|uniref:bifunctional diaminohydroxyphosphoribosylaminopyrimidine deaminase/5-amino-6-(5-phosphoribosylamino)uracil reductase RibD n=1 Tax=Oceanicaulis sp. MMSF_3324 TaxID=3046702 RepID=UPI00273DFC39|nr:bifunctional diaminohydroxyphosphoribosylaminopyrimidine deaminase/5-amino-6-(5-phosphoribosylamino)uracil reductase RibD [Oceanicaulis sp. MMSF_3324]
MRLRPVTAEDLRLMDTALALAYARLGATAPNPSVGCVIVRGDRIVGAAATAPGGRPHAEPQALEQAGALARGATVYVTLEPCAHYGKTPPCAEALVAAQPAEVVIACRDPFEHVAGRGVSMLKEAGIVVVEGVREAEAMTLNAGFFQRLKTGRPLLAQDTRASLYDADLELEAGEDIDTALARLGAQGLTRVRQR